MGAKRDWGIKPRPDNVCSLPRSSGRVFSIGPKPILCHREGMLFPSFAAVDGIHRSVIADSTNKILPGEEKAKLLPTPPELSPQQEEKRRAWQVIFENTAARVLEAISV